MACCDSLLCATQDSAAAAGLVDDPIPPIALAAMSELPAPFKNFLRLLSAVLIGVISGVSFCFYVANEKRMS